MSDSAPFGQERRPITTLFADLRGYTTASERNDPEVVDEVIRGLFDPMEAVIERAGGLMPSRAGDGFIALFGTPVASEDDPERALECALQLRDMAAASQERFREQLGMELPMRIGVNTGQVVVGRPTERDEPVNITGDAVNVASRLEGRASAGTILASDATRRLAGPGFRWGPSTLLHLKNREKPVEAHELLGLADPAPLTATRAGGVFIGRDSDLGTLSKAWSLAERGEAQVVLLRGAAGIGKSRLVHEFLERLADRSVMPVVALASCTPRGSGSLDPIRRMVVGCLGLDPDVDSLSEPSRRAVDRLLLSSQDKAEGLARGDFVAGLVDLFSEWAGDRGAVLVLEDAQWADTSSLHLLHELIRSLRDRRILFIVTLRRWGRRPPRGLRVSASVVSLGPLSAAESNALLDDIVDGPGAIDAEIRSTVLRKAEGNPLFIEEIAKMLAVPQAATRSSPGLLDPVPDTIEQIFLARLDEIEPRSRRIAQEAAVVGRAFPDDLLASVTDSPGAIGTALRRLEREELVREWAPDVSGRGHEFTHYLTWNTIYESMLIRRRAELHLRTAAAVERMYPDEIGRFADVLAMHYELGGRPDLAATHHLVAGRNADLAYAHREARASQRRAARLVGLTTLWSLGEPRVGSGAMRRMAMVSLQSLVGLTLVMPIVMFIFAQGPSKSQRTLGLPLALFEPGVWLSALPLLTGALPVFVVGVTIANWRSHRYLRRPAPPWQLVIDCLVNWLLVVLALIVTFGAIYLGVRAQVVGALPEIYAFGVGRRLVQEGFWSTTASVIIGSGVAAVVLTGWVAARTSQWRLYLARRRQAGRSGDLSGDRSQYGGVAALLAGVALLAVAMVLLYIRGLLPGSAGTEPDWVTVATMLLFQLALLTMAFALWAYSRRLGARRAVLVGWSRLKRWHPSGPDPVSGVRRPRGLGMEVPLLVGVALGIVAMLPARESVIESVHAPSEMSSADAQRLLDWFPNTALAHAQRGVSYLGDQPSDPVNAIRSLETAVERDPELTSALALLVVTYAGAGDIEQALETADALVRAEPDHPTSYYLRGVVRRVAGLPAAEQDFAVAARMEVADPQWDAFNSRCQARQELGMFGAALVDCLTAVDLNPRLADDVGHQGLLMSLQAGVASEAEPRDQADPPTTEVTSGANLTEADLESRFAFHDLRAFDDGPLYTALDMVEVGAEHGVVAGSWEEFVDPTGPGELFPVVMILRTDYESARGADAAWVLHSDPAVLQSLRDNVPWSPAPDTFSIAELAADEVGLTHFRMTVALGDEMRTEEAVVLRDENRVTLYVVSSDTGFDINEVLEMDQDRLDSTVGVGDG